MARPIPRPAPVTTAIRSSSRPMVNPVQTMTASAMPATPLSCSAGPNTT
jgi:hypothetical protein